MALDPFCHLVQRRLCFYSSSPVSDRRFHVFCIYVPKAVDHHRAECRALFDELSSLVIDISLRDHILICGDLNNPLTADECRVKNEYGESNSNSETLQVFINLHDLIAANGIMRQKQSKLPTFDGPRWRCTCFDWIFGKNRTQGHEYQNNGLDFRSSVIIHR